MHTLIQYHRHSHPHTTWPLSDLRHLSPDQSVHRCPITLQPPPPPPSRSSCQKTRYTLPSNYLITLYTPLNSLCNTTKIPDNLNSQQSSQLFPSPLQHH